MLIVATSPGGSQGIARKHPYHAVSPTMNSVPTSSAAGSTPRIMNSVTSASPRLSIARITRERHRDQSSWSSPVIHLANAVTMCRNQTCGANHAPGSGIVPEHVDDKDWHRCPRHTKHVVIRGTVITCEHPRSCNHH